MAKFNTYGFQVNSEDAVVIHQGKVTALSLESAWHKAVEEAFDAASKDGRGLAPTELYVYRIKPPSESHG